MPRNRQLSPSMEDYLEAIYLLVLDRKVARIGEIAKTLKVKTPSVNNAVKNLVGGGLVEHDKYGFVDLTERGKIVARQICRRHEVLREFLSSVLGVDPATAEKDACEMEHVISKETLERIVSFIEFSQVCPMGDGLWVRRFKEFCDRGPTQDKCEECLDDCKQAVDHQKDRRLTKTTRTLNDLEIGEKAIIIRVRGRDEIHRRMLDMGIVPGTVIEVERVAPLGDPLEVRVRGYHLSLRREEAKKILVDCLPQKERQDIPA